MGINFKNGEEMYKYLCSSGDLYSKGLGICVFEYNDAHTLCYYPLDEADVSRLVKLTSQDKENWSAYLGFGGHILVESKYDIPKYRYSEDKAIRKLYLQPSIDFCEAHYWQNDWVDTKDVVISDNEADNTYLYKVFITQIRDGESLGVSLLCENYETLEDARKEGEIKLLFKESFYEVKEYDASAKVFMYGTGDNGKVVYSSKK